MSAESFLFPRKPRNFAGKRWVNISLRTLHLIGIAGIGAAFLYTADKSQWLPYFLLTMSSGLALVVLEIWSNGIWLIQLRGIATVLKLGILSLALVYGLQAWMLITIIVIASVFAHAPGDVRYYSPFHGKRIEKL